MTQVRGRDMNALVSTRVRPKRVRKVFRMEEKRKEAFSFSWKRRKQVLFQATCIVVEKRKKVGSAKRTILSLAILLGVGIRIDARTREIDVSEPERRNAKRRGEARRESRASPTWMKTVRERGTWITLDDGRNGCWTIPRSFSFFVVVKKNKSGETNGTMSREASLVGSFVTPRRKGIDDVVREFPATRRALSGRDPDVQAGRARNLTRSKKGRNHARTSSDPILPFQRRAGSVRIPAVRRVGRSRAPPRVPCRPGILPSGSFVRTEKERDPRTEPSWCHETIPDDASSRPPSRW